MTLIEKIARSFDEKQWEKDEHVLADFHSSELQRLYVYERRKTFMARADAALKVINMANKETRQASPFFVFAVGFSAGIVGTIVLAGVLYG